MAFQMKACVQRTTPITESSQDQPRAGHSPTCGPARHRWTGPPIRLRQAIQDRPAATPRPIETAALKSRSRISSRQQLQIARPGFKIEADDGCGDNRQQRDDDIQKCGRMPSPREIDHRREGDDQRVTGQKDTKVQRFHGAASAGFGFPTCWLMRAHHLDATPPQQDDKRPSIIACGDALS